MRQSSISFKSKGVMLEGVMASPTGVRYDPSLPRTFPGVVVCHPHPVFGGNMDNGLVLAVCQALVKEGFIALRFNFRGVGNSEGTFVEVVRGREGDESATPSTGPGASSRPFTSTPYLDDVRAALSVLRQWPGVNRERLGLAGYSFGASMVLAGVSSYKAARAFVLISPPLSALDHARVDRDKKPKLIIVGERDRLVPYSSLKERVDSLHKSADLWTVPGADHSWRGYEAEAAQQTARFFADRL